MINSAAIIPTGDEILDGTVIDTNSPAIMKILLENFPACEIFRVRPVQDLEEEIICKIKLCLDRSFDLIVLIGGSGGGRKFLPELRPDLTHSAMISFLKDYAVKEIYGKNGHLWARIVAGMKNSTCFINVPGPYTETVAGIKAAVKVLKKRNRDPEELAQNIADAVVAQYPNRAAAE